MLPFKSGWHKIREAFREAITQKEPIKALNSFGFMDTFENEKGEQVDEPLIALMGEIEFDIFCKAVIAKFGATGAVGFIAIFDFYDLSPT